MEHKPCPFCGSDELELYHDYPESDEPDYVVRQVWCPWCCAEGPIGSGDDDAWEKWDSRHAT